MRFGVQRFGVKRFQVSGFRKRQSDIEEFNYYLRCPGGWPNIKDKEIPKLAFRSRIQEPES